MPLVTFDRPKCTRPHRSTACTDLHAGTGMTTDLLVGIPSARWSVQLPGCNIRVREALPIASFITPVPGGVGPMTIAALLLEQTVVAAERRMLTLID